MGTNRSSETLAEAAYLRSLRTTTQAQADQKARERSAQVRYAPHDRHVAAAH